MPRTSYALKTFGSSIGRMLTAALLAAVLVATAGAAGSSSRTLYALDIPGPGVDLVRLSAPTLAETGRVQLDDFQTRGAVAPNGLRVALSGVSRLSFFDGRTLRMTGTLPVRGNVLWPLPRTVLVVDAATLTRVDPDIPAVVRTWPSQPFWYAARGAGRIVGIVRPKLEASPILIGDPIRVQVLSAAGPLGPTGLHKLRLANEDWRVGQGGGLLPPLAAEAVATARGDLANRINVPPGEIGLNSVVPYRLANGIGSHSGYELVLSARGGYFKYTAVILEDGNGRLRVFYRSQLPGPPGPSANDIAHAEVGDWEVSTVVWAVDGARGRAYGVTSGSVFVVVDLRTGNARLRPLAQPPADLHCWCPAFVGSHTIVVPTAPLRLLDTRSGRLRRSKIIEKNADGSWPPFEIVGAGHRFFVYNLPSGLKLADARGRLLRLYLPGKAVQAVQVVGRYAYASYTDHDWQHPSVAIIDPGKARVIRRVPGGVELALLIGGG